MFFDALVSRCTELHSALDILHIIGDTIVTSLFHIKTMYIYTLISGETFRKLSTPRPAEPRADADNLAFLPSGLAVNSADDPMALHKASALQLGLPPLMLDLAQELEQAEHNINEAMEEQEAAPFFHVFSSTLTVTSQNPGVLAAFAALFFVWGGALQACRVRLQKTTIQSEHMKRWAVSWRL